MMQCLILCYAALQCHLVKLGTKIVIDVQLL